MYENLLVTNFWVGLCLFALASCATAQAAENGELPPVYRCPGPPVIYTDKISEEEARKRNCRRIEGGAITIARPEPSVSVTPSRWLLVGEGAKLKVYFDKQTIRRSGASVRVWLKWNGSEPSQTTRLYPPKDYLSEKTFAIYDCSGRTSKTTQVLRYAESDAAGEMVENLSVNEAVASPTPIAPETLGESILEAVCAYTTGTR